MPLNTTAALTVGLHNRPGFPVGLHNRLDSPTNLWQILLQLFPYDKFTKIVLTVKHHQLLEAYTNYIFCNTICRKICWWIWAKVIRSMFYWQSSHTNKISLFSSTPAQLLCDHKLHGPEHCTQPSTDSQYLPRQNRQGVLSSSLSDIVADRFCLVQEAFDVCPFDFFGTATRAVFLFCSTAITEFAALLSMITFAVDCDTTGESTALLLMREAVVVFPLVNFFVTATLAPRESAAFALITGSAVIPESVHKKSLE